MPPSYLMSASVLITHNTQVSQMQTRGAELEVAAALSVQLSGCLETAVLLIGQLGSNQDPQLCWVRELPPQVNSSPVQGAAHPYFTSRTLQERLIT